MNEDERMSDTLSKWERISKGSSIREMKLVFKVEYYELSKRMYSQLPLSRLRLSRISAYLEEKIWSLF